MLFVVVWIYFFITNFLEPIKLNLIVLLFSSEFWQRFVFVIKEANEEFKHVLLAFIYDKADQTSPVANEVRCIWYFYGFLLLFVVFVDSCNSLIYLLFVYICVSSYLSKINWLSHLLITWYCNSYQFCFFFPLPNINIHRKCGYSVTCDEFNNLESFTIIMVF